MSTTYRLILILVVFATSSISLYAQEKQRIAIDDLSPSQVQAAKNLSPSQIQAAEKVLSKSDGKATAEAIEALKADPELKDIKIEGLSKPEEQSEIPETGLEIDDKTETEIPRDSSRGIEDPGGEYADKHFGRNVFKPARERILAIERGLALGLKPETGRIDAIAGFVGPLDMVSLSVNATVPSKYLLGPGDHVVVYFWGDQIALNTEQLIIDGQGEISVPKGGRLVVRGMTLPQLQNALKEKMQLNLGIQHKEINIIATLNRLRSIQVFITGEAFRPGTYAVSAVTSLFNALYACGGPNGYGSLREIKLLTDRETLTIDFYDYLLGGDSSQDYPLQPGDTIFISRAKRQISIEGEVNRPSIYELKKGEGLEDLIQYANGLKPTSFIQRIQIRSIRPNKERIIVDVDMSRGSSDVGNIQLSDGDSVMVSSVLPDIENMVILEGKVNRPGTYELKDGMKISDLFSDANQPLGEVYMERADLIRLNEDRKTTSLIHVNLGKALAGEADYDIKLASLDRLVVYSKWDIQFFPPRMIRISGPVQRPGNYERSDAMTIKDLLLRAGGILPTTYLNRADLNRYDFIKEVTRIIPLDLRKVLDGDDSANILLEDRDVLRLYTIKESQFIPERSLTISGPVQRPGKYERSEDMTIRDLLVKAGGLLPTTYLNRADLNRYDFIKEVTRIIPLDLRKVLDGDDSANILLEDRDVLRLYTIKESQFIPERSLTISGPVQRPGKYERSEDMTIRDLLVKAGGLLPDAYLSRADLLRYDYTTEKYINIPVNLAGVLEGEPSENIKLNDRDRLTVYAQDEVRYIPKHTISIHGHVQRPGDYTRFEGMRINDLLFAAGGLLPGAYENIEIAKSRSKGKTEIVVINYRSLRMGHEEQNLILDDDDVVSVRRNSSFFERPRWVEIEGEVRYPGEYALSGKDDRLGDLIERAGGLTEHAYPKGSVFMREREHIPSNEQRAQLSIVDEDMNAQNELAYLRQQMRNELLMQQARAEAGDENVSTTGAGVSAIVPSAAEAGAIAMVPGVVGATGQTAERLIGLAEDGPAVIGKPRKLNEGQLMPSEKERLIMSVMDAIFQRGSIHDVLLSPGDSVFIPRRVDTVSVAGALVFPTLVQYSDRDGVDHEYYIGKAGGPSEDANIEETRVLRVDGSIIHLADIEKIEPGDIIYVPTQVQELEIVKRIDRILDTVKFVVITLTSAATLLVLLAMF